MTDDEWNFISKCLNELDTENKKFMEATDGLMIAPESPLIVPFWRASSITLKALSRLADDIFYSLEWYMLECDFGRDPKEAGVGDDMQLINDHDKLRWLIELSNKHIK